MKIFFLLSISLADLNLEMIVKLKGGHNCSELLNLQGKIIK
jgi:hypothetical protein